MVTIINNIIDIFIIIFLELIPFIRNFNLKKLKCIICSIPRDLQLIYFLLKTYVFVLYYKFFNLTILNKLYAYARTKPDHIFLIGIDGKQYTYKQVEEFSNKLAVFVESHGFKAGDCIALLMDSSPEFIMCWYALGKLKIISSFINNNLSSDQIKYAIESSKCTGLIFSKQYEGNVANIPLSGVKKYLLDGSSDVPDCINLQESLQHIPPIDIKPKASLNDILCYIFTSGTTGFPKPVVIKHRKVIDYCRLSFGVGLNENDRVYSFLPLYHSSGGIVGACGAIVNGSTLVIRKKFSSSNFVNDCLKYKINVFFYIGEVCRYICNIPKTDDETKIKLKLILGNGLRKPVWLDIKNRFNIERIYEFYGSSEGNAYMINLEGKPGCCGYLPTLLKDHFIFSLIKSNDEGELLKDIKSRPLVAEENEVGQLISSLSKYNILTNCSKYLQNADNDKKIAKNVFRTGDAFFLTGDLLTMDEYGYLYFYDRIGDTYRWKGENCSTTELESYFLKLVDIADVVAFSVEIPGHEGKAGMVGITTSSYINISLLTKHVDQLPPYQRPLFIRIMPKIDTNSTSKHPKQEIRRIGYDISKTSDHIFVYQRSKGYLPLTPKIYNDIIESKLEF